MQLLCFWTLNILLFWFKTHIVSEIGFCLRHYVKPTQLGPIDRARPQHILERREGFED
jgi:hypothetical protein